MKTIKAILILLLSSFSLFAWAQRGLPAGAEAPNFLTQDNNGNTLELKKLLKDNHSVVLIFYRGQWCPYCNKYMQKLQDSLNFIISKKAYVVAISPETNEAIAKTKEKTHSSFSLVHDTGYKIMKDYDVQYTVPPEVVAKLKGYNIDLATNNGNTDNVLPVPATYIISPDGKIKFVHFNKDYRQRMSVSSILNQL